MPVLTNPIRLEVMRRLSALLSSTLDGTSPYVIDVGGRVFRGRSFFGDETALPCVSILEAPIPLDQLPSAKDNAAQAGPWELVVQGWVKDDMANPTDPAHVFLADVKRCLAVERKKANWMVDSDGIFGLGRAVTALYIGPGVVRPPDEISAKAYFWLTITLDLVEDMEDPYAA